MNRQERRYIKARVQAAHKHNPDQCDGCGRFFEHGDPVYTGATFEGSWGKTAECCREKLLMSISVASVYIKKGASQNERQAALAAHPLRHVMEKPV